MRNMNRTWTRMRILKRHQFLNRIRTRMWMWILKHYQLNQFIQKNLWSPKSKIIHGWMVINRKLIRWQMQSLMLIPIRKDSLQRSIRWVSSWLIIEGKVTRIVTWNVPIKSRRWWRKPWINMKFHIMLRIIQNELRSHRMSIGNQNQFNHGATWVSVHHQMLLWREMKLLFLFFH